MATNDAVNVGLSGVTGSGNFVGATSPTLVTPALGTPASGLLSNCTFDTGSWTPALAGSSVNPTSITYSFQVGEYIKVGNILFYSARVIVSALTIGSAAGQLQITGLPFTAVNATANDPIGSALVQNVTVNAGTLYIISRVTHNTTIVNLIENDNVAGAASTVQITSISATSDITVSGFYFTS